MISANKLMVGGAPMLADKARNHHRAIDGEINSIPLLTIRLRE